MRPVEAATAVCEASSAFERRWTLRSLKTRDPGLFARFEEQRSLYETALITGSEADLDEHAGGMMRAWAAVTARMQDVPDDAYMVGRCPNTGLEVRIGHQLAAAVDGVVHMTPDEVAVMVAGVRSIVSLKRAFPGAQLDAFHSGEPAKDDC